MSAITAVAKSAQTFDRDLGSMHIARSILPTVTGATIGCNACETEDFIPVPESGFAGVQTRHHSIESLTRLIDHIRFEHVSPADLIRKDVVLLARFAAE